jgi:hypothetical protein
MHLNVVHACALLTLQFGQPTSAKYLYDSPWLHHAAMFVTSSMKTTFSISKQRTSAKRH